MADNLDRFELGEVLHGEHPDVPFRWALERWLPEDIGTIGPLATVIPLRHARPDDLEQLRSDRMTQVVRDKLPKLAATGAGRLRTILVLEHKDQHMSGPKLVSQALQRCVCDT